MRYRYSIYPRASETCLRLWSVMLMNHTHVKCVCVCVFPQNLLWLIHPFFHIQIRLTINTIQNIISIHELGSICEQLFLFIFSKTEIKFNFCMYNNNLKNISTIYLYSSTDNFQLNVRNCMFFQNKKQYRPKFYDDTLF